MSIGFIFFLSIPLWPNRGGGNKRLKKCQLFLPQNDFYGPKIHFALDGRWVHTLEGPIKPYTYYRGQKQFLFNGHWVQTNLKYFKNKTFFLILFWPLRPEIWTSHVWYSYLRDKRSKSKLEKSFIFKIFINKTRGL